MTLLGSHTCNSITGLVSSKESGWLWDYNSSVMPIQVYITIDTEEDAWDEYSREDNSVENIEQIPALQEIFDRYGAKPTYLLTYPVATASRSIEILRPIQESGRCEIGTHCHPWNTPPFEEPLNARNSMLCNLPADLVEQKLHQLHATIVERFVCAPTSFRAGRWGFSSTVAKAIRALGYWVDTSVTPLVSWERHQGPDFSNAPSRSYWLDPEDITSEAPAEHLLEVPPTIGFLQRNFERCRRLRTAILQSPLSRFHLLGALDRLRLLNRCWLSPELASAPQMILLATRFLDSGASYLNLSFHSTSLLPGKSPFVPNDSARRDFLLRIERFLQFANERGLRFSNLSNAVDSLP